MLSMFPKHVAGCGSRKKGSRPGARALYEVVVRMQAAQGFIRHALVLCNETNANQAKKDNRWGVDTKSGGEMHHFGDVCVYVRVCVCNASINQIIHPSTC